MLCEGQVFMRNAYVHMRITNGLFAARNGQIMYRWLTVSVGRVHDCSNSWSTDFFKTQEKLPNNLVKFTG